MKVTFTKAEVEEILLNYVSEMIVIEDNFFNNVRISEYSADYCVVTYVPLTQEQKLDNMAKALGITE